MTALDCQYEKERIPLNYDFLAKLEQITSRSAT